MRARDVQTGRGRANAFWPGIQAFSLESSRREILASWMVCFSFAEKREGWYGPKPCRNSQEPIDSYLRQSLSFGTQKYKPNPVHHLVSPLMAQMAG
jgi:hypothetical protein